MDAGTALDASDSVTSDAGVDAAVQDGGCDGAGSCGAIAVGVVAAAPVQADAPAMRAPAEGAIDVTVRGDGKADRMRRSAEAVKVVELAQAKRESADLGEVLARTPGVSVQRRGALGSGMRLSLNGLTEEQIRFFLDGIPIEYTLYTNSVANVPLNLVERVEIYSGVLPLRFGADALGGAVNLATDRRAFGNRAAASYQVGSFGTQRASASAQYRLPGSAVYMRASGFFDDADNDYPVDVMAPNAVGVPKPARVYRFHDAYRAFGGELEGGIVGRSWARRLALSGFASTTDSDVQHNANMTAPYGGITAGETAVGGTARYDNTWREAISLEAIVGFSYRRSTWRDVSRCVYDWFGRCGSQRNAPGEQEEASDSAFWTKAGFGRFNLSIRLHAQHTLRASFAPTLFGRTGEENYRNAASTIDKLDAERRLDSFVNGLEYELKLFDDRLENLLFVKQYLQYQRSDQWRKQGGTRVRLDRDTQRFGGGDGIRFRITEWLTAKASYEYATRLPGPNQVFGDTSQIKENLSLRPETSHNGNLSIAASHAHPRVGAYRTEIAGFVRDLDDLIQAFGSDGGVTNRNVSSARSTGVELSTNWASRREIVSLGANFTYQNYINISTSGMFAEHKGERMAGRPWLFANGTAQLKGRSLFSPTDELALTCHVRWVNGYFVGWQKSGNAGDKLSVDDQLTEALNLTYVARGERSTFTSSVEIDNLSDAKVYDFYGVQRPGRAFYAKLTVSH